MDIRGWYDQGKVIGVIFTELISTDVPMIEKIIGKVYGRIARFIHAEWVSMLNISYHIFPENDGTLSIQGPFNTTLYPDLKKRTHDKQLSVMTKNTVDILLSAAALIVLSPLFFRHRRRCQGNLQRTCFFSGRKEWGSEREALQIPQIPVHVYGLRFFQPSEVYRKVHLRAEKTLPSSRGFSK